MSRKWVLTGVAVLAVTATAGVLAYTWTATGPPSAGAGPAPAQTVAIVRADLSDTREVAGTLGYGAETPLKGHKAGTITWLPQVGGEIDRGKVLYKVDEQPVLALFGDTPLYRKLDTPGTKGKDVKVLEANLAALGYSPGTVDEEFTAATSAAVKKWQRANGVKETGAVDPGDVVVLQAKSRISAVKAQLGDPAEGELLSVTGTSTAVTVPLDPGQVSLAAKDAKVGVTLPTGKQVLGTVAQVGTSVQSGKGSDPNSSPKVTVTITLDEPGNFESAPVRVQFTTETHKGVLAVPITALVALREGGYAVQVRGGGLVAVKTGLFSQGRVEITGSGLVEGTQVVIAT
ncbi:peptidoglycan-binding protein [Kutzneria albida]|uniref:Peptidoglycan-binding domain 1 protein n=1 Tax=Kutzneria albida DSM 43870 TaxID=1449976 RepID=W5W6L0_9PSEU|nr:peptidoglycan-binding protein [Kutzneria albida]AHH96542.1 peptidoglycan-binding domain 1 protein [Kutzneria albida DSM 43870]